MVRAALAGAGKTQKELAEHMGWTPQNLSGRLKNNSLTFDELSKALHFAGYEVSMSDANGAGLPMFEDFYVELFEDAAGNYFTVLYQLSGCQHHTITPVSARAAQQFLERFGSRA